MTIPGPTRWFPRWFRRGFRSPRKALAAAALLLCSAAAQALPIPFGERETQITAREQPIAAFLQDFFGQVDLPVAVSPTVKGAVNGNFNGPADRTWRNVSRAFNLVAYYDGAVVHIYAPQDLTTRTMPVSATVAARVMRAAQEQQMTDARNALRSARDGGLTASGTKRFIEQIEELARAQTFGDRSAPSGFKIYYLRYAWAQDVNSQFGGRQVVLPGVASIVRAMMTAQPRSQVSVTAYEQNPRATVPRARGGMRSPNTPVGTLGDGDAWQPSGPTLAAAYGAGALPGMVANGAPAANGAQPPWPAVIALGDAQQVRVEADARLNAVIVRDQPERIAQYDQLIAALDVEPQALEIEATIIDLNTDRLRDLGINWRFTKGRGSLLFGNGTESDLRLTPTTPPGDITPIGAGGFVSAVLGNVNQFIARISLLEEKGAARVVSSPQVMTLSNVEAVFDNSQTFYVRVAGRDDVDLFNVSAGTTLRVTPHVFKEGGEVRIKMLVTVEDGALSGRTVDTLPVVERSAINTQALIFEGESLLVGGITRETTGDTRRQVPGIGDVPVLGALFRETHTQNSRVERMFLISPRLSARRGAPRGAPPRSGMPIGANGIPVVPPLPGPASVAPQPGAPAAAPAVAAPAPVKTAPPPTTNPINPAP